MCGICGFMNLDGQTVDREVGLRMVEILQHRGPDGEGNLVTESPGANHHPAIFLGHSRLKIIDLTESAKQPLPNEDGKVWVIFNGEIYNFRELRTQLEGQGHVFRSRSDTEVIVHAYEEFGNDFLLHLDGMFAFALWDEKKSLLLLARDRAGKKPLFYHFDGRRFTFGSEIKALLVCPWVGRGVAVERLPEYLFYGLVPSPNTLYRGVLQLPPASYLIINQDGLQGPFQYWQFQFPEPGQMARLSRKEAAEKVRGLLTQAVARRLTSDVPLGVLLSGGMDSSIVVGIMSQILKNPVRTFSVGFTEEASFDERPYALTVARHFKTEHTDFVVKMDTISLMERLLWHHDQPYGDYSAIPTYLVSKLSRQYVTVVLNGDGGDEVFAGYDRFKAALIAEKIPRCLWASGRLMSKFLPKQYGYSSLKRRMERFFGDFGDTVHDKYLGWTSIFHKNMLYELIRPDIQNSLKMNGVESTALAYLEATKRLPLLHQLLYLNFKTYLPDDLLVKMDRMAMANSLETRSPFLDTSLIEFTATLPPEMKLAWGQSKYILRLAFRDLLPPEIMRRRKHGFSVPLGLWFHKDLGRQFEELVLSDTARSQSYLNKQTVRKLFQEHLDRTNDHSARLWVLLQLELWLRMLEQDPHRRFTRIDSEICDVRKS